jgi:CheY-like chemotaxis protein/HEAT repeat protein
MGDYLSQMKKSLKTAKMGQLKTLLGDLSSQHIQLKLEVLELLALTSDKTALEVLSFLTSKKYKDPDIHDRLIQLITDRAHLNFAFALILMENADITVIEQSTPLFRHILSNETDKDLLGKILKAAGKRQIDLLTDDIAEFIFYDDLTLKSESITALERIGSKNALEKLVQASQTEKCDQDILDAIQVLSSRKEPAATETTPPAPDKIPAPREPEHILPELNALQSDDFQKRFDAFTSLSQEEPKTAARLLRQTEEGDHDLTLNLLRLVKRTIPFSATIRIFDILNQKETENMIKFAAYSALESYPELKSAASVVQGLSESALFVRMAAIRVLDKNLSDFVFAEIKNKIESGTKKGEALAENILDAQAENIIEQLMISDTFSYIASNYLSKRSPLCSLDTFIDILKRRNLQATAKKYNAIREQRSGRHERELIVISSCEAVLSTYNKLICGCGFHAHLFDNPQDAFETILAQRPDAIICDLFLNDITGLDFAAEIRDLYTADDVPVIVSTLQQGLDVKKLETAMKKVGVNGWCHFPAKPNQIKSWIK